ncbi:peroxiredoxin [Mucilaginibacter yixingensis]|uniref:Peroxiredoxin n=1 Tax=Mucilaginibacter yixingensis TaxID=1295612 RepID=A0A2T5JEP1_9SPHI|nr:TlpA disulfide reductase family protein [Mucilaginibacter yixingensis]PTR00879.1 peroxiredoxin [Mucilaginibacter yixingensis]
MTKKVFLSLLALAISVNVSLAQNKLKTGTWRGVLRPGSATELPFNFEVKDVADKQQLYIINGDEHFNVPDVRTVGDSVLIKMPLFDSEFKLVRNGEGLQGKFIKHLGVRDTYTDFSAVPDVSYRFFQNPEKAAFNVTGRWSAVFGSGAKRDTTVGEFKQTGNRLTGTFLTTSGDYRYLEGVVTGNKLYLSCFDGGHAFLFTATVKNDNTITDGNFGGDTWTAVRNENAKLPDAYSLTSLKPGDKTISFSFKDLGGKAVSLNDARFKNKVVIVQFMGSWCPNCMDETSFLVNYYKKYHPKGVEIVGLAYERTKDFTQSKRTLTQLKNRFSIPYPLLITGFTPGNGGPVQSIPQLANFIGFPTTIIIDKKGEVAKIHAGFSGPGTGEHYTEFVKEFEQLTDKLLTAE